MVAGVKKVLSAWCFACLLCAAVQGGEPQPKLPEKTLSIGTVAVRSEVASNAATREAGLMHREKLEDGQGMLFVFSAPQPMSFWMQNTKLPLSIAYINAAGIIREIHDMKPFDTTPVQSVFPDILYALEVPQGWFQRNKILPGDRISGLPGPSAE